MYSFLTQKLYKQYPSWNDKYPNNEVDLTDVSFHSSWKPMFKTLFSDPKFVLIEDGLSNELKNSDGNLSMYPLPDFVFHAFRLTTFDKVKVVIIGQDPYFNKGEAMGLSFSVPFGATVPSSLKNIYLNMWKNKNIKSVPQFGNLEFWAQQGCLMLNTSLTVLDGDKNKNCHQNLWKWFTDKIIRYISEKGDKIVFVLWGGNALEKLSLIDLDKHDVVVSSHPSGLSCNKSLKSYPSFDSFDHFGEINSILRKWGKEEILWQN